MKTKAEIIACLETGAYPLDGFSNFGVKVLTRFLPFDEAAAFRSKYAMSVCRCEVLSLDRDTVIAQMVDYMGRVAWKQATHRRGISASRSVNKMKAWCWLLGEDGEVDWNDYAPYGIPILLAVCRKYGFPVPDGVSLDIGVVSR